MRARNLAAEIRRQNGPKIQTCENLGDSLRANSEGVLYYSILPPVPEKRDLDRAYRIVLSDVAALVPYGGVGPLGHALAASLKRACFRVITLACDVA